MTMMEDYIKFVRKCYKCQIHGDIIHRPPTELHSISSPWPFSAWGLDIIREIQPTASKRHRFILVAVDYFTKWVEVELYIKLGAKQVEKFIKKNLICRYEISYHIVSDNGVQFQGKVRELLRSYKVEHHKSSPYRPQANGVVDVAKKTSRRSYQRLFRLI